MSPCQGEGRGFESLPPLMKNNQKIFSLLRQIPKGKVTTYKSLAKKAFIKNPRTVGSLLHQNTNPKTYPCHRVVRSDGTIANGYAFVGKSMQIDKLKKDGVKIIDGKINLQRYLYNFQ